jgi:heme ABC exporter ATP-binding subunit CcmA
MLELIEVVKTIAGRRILEISLRLEPGRYLLLGPNGAGKTTLLKLLAGLWRPSSGRVLYNGKDIAELNGSYRREMALLPHELGLYEELTGLQNLMFFGALYGLRRPKQRALELLELVGLRFFLHERVKAYSQGMKQRLALAKALLHRPRVLLLDEPFAGLDLRGAELLRQILAEAVPPDGLLILTAHEPERGFRVADRFLYLERGALKAYGDRARFDDEGIGERLRGVRDVGVY